MKVSFKIKCNINLKMLLFIVGNILPSDTQTVYKELIAEINVLGSCMQHIPAKH